MSLLKFNQRIPRGLCLGEFIPKMYKFKKIFKQFNVLSQKTDTRFPLKWRDRQSCLNDATANTDFDRHYVYHLAWAARILKEIYPDKHIDIGSFIHFPAMLSAFFPIEYYEYRQPEIQLDNLVVGNADLTSLPFSSNSVDSLSCMHVVEHIGLGRYGDKLDYDGDLKAIREISRVLAEGGDLLFVVPVGRPKIMFNAHRIYSFDQIIDYFSTMQLKEFALIPDNTASGGLIRNASKALFDSQEYGCGCFWFKK